MFIVSTIDASGFPFTDLANVADPKTIKADPSFRDIRRDSVSTIVEIDVFR